MGDGISRVPEIRPGRAVVPKFEKLVRLTQRLLDRCLFLLFCEDMGKSLDFPGDLLRDILIAYSKDPYYSPADNL
ncbi:MAG: hypothetical protein PHO37_17715, partial [Kiritimatiellae bacterium]|nr:hypothetical protein [Kiritimatiellia bacterium]